MCQFLFMPNVLVVTRTREVKEVYRGGNHHISILNTKQNYLSAKPCSVVRFITCLLPTHNKGINFVMPPMYTSLSEALSMCPYIHGVSFEGPKFLCVYVEMLS